MISAAPLRLSQRTIDCWLPARKFRSWDWIKDNVHSHKGQPFNHVEYPWVEGICDAWDRPGCRRVFYQAGSRLGKTETLLALMICAQYHDPDIGMIGGSTEALILRTLGDRFYGMLEKSHATRDLCPPKWRQNRRKVNARTFKIYGAWSGSPTTLGDLDPRYLAALEVDKFTKNNSEEADPFELLMERGAEIPDRKFIGESTPTVEGRSRIAKYVAMGSNKRYFVPCPKCSHYQKLDRNRSGDAKDGGLWWDREKDGTTTADRAWKTARYICAGCNAELSEENRRLMVRRGKWVANGQAIRKDGEILGRPNNDGPDESFQLSRLYGATFSFGAYARSYVQSLGDSESERSFANNWDGETWVPTKVQMQWQDLAERLCTGDYPIGMCPTQSIFITTAVDVQIDHFVCTAFAWAHQARGYLIKYGIAHSWAQVKEWTESMYPHLDGGKPLPSYMNIVDSRDGNRKDEIIDFCKASNRPSGPWVWPSMGARPGTMNMQMFRKSAIDSENRIGKKATRAIEGLHLVMVNTTMTQEWIDNAMTRRRPGDPLSITLPEDAIGDRDLFDQLLNERYNADTGKWDRIDESTVPVDFRDCFRYARTAAEVYVNGNWHRIPQARTLKIETKEERHKRQATSGKTAASGFIRKPGRFIGRG